MNHQSDLVMSSCSLLLSALQGIMLLLKYVLLFRFLQLICCDKLCPKDPAEQPAPIRADPYWAVSKP